MSLLERNRSKLPIGVLKKLSDVLGVHMNWFFNGNMQATAGAGPLELLMSTIEPGANSGEYSHDGNDAGVLVAGQLQLEEGDSFSFSSTSQHRCAVANIGKTDGVLARWGQALLKFPWYSRRSAMI
ncbi:cupin domain-containing protein [Bradyrhizobium sp. CCBAU 25360]|uniref:cupin domain-containing protein n=1 Tax=Bradyrhizobium sp. CCBAU 25360 TaxID=858425 RepID=UPI002306186D|nr:cupin domain-containing protein [Bradyrhizobium sp. CCBAU 25360]